MATPAERELRCHSQGLLGAGLLSPLYVWTEDLLDDATVKGERLTALPYLQIIYDSGYGAVSMKNNMGFEWRKRV